ncbi:hypothetical protein DFH07DRAFT_779826 [Mycena maculata]|uniref:Uncharacterized protein n=1 Tax=Mycena maculata TaxID=230809 RepID=A0AAD7I691_9AGAR|nr:hypothetical protein DFH07DRAFT_779826 [Mycena maculata]
MPAGDWEAPKSKIGGRVGRKEDAHASAEAQKYFDSVWQRAGADHKYLKIDTRDEVWAVISRSSTFTIGKKPVTDLNHGRCPSNSNWGQDAVLLALYGVRAKARQGSIGQLKIRCKWTLLWSELERHVKTDQGEQEETVCAFYTRERVQNGEMLKEVLSLGMARGPLNALFFAHVPRIEEAVAVSPYGINTLPGVAECPLVASEQSFSHPNQLHDATFHCRSGPFIHTRSMRRAASNWTGINEKRKRKRGRARHDQSAHQAITPRWSHTFVSTFRVPQWDRPCNTTYLPTYRSSGANSGKSEMIGTLKTLLAHHRSALSAHHFLLVIQPVVAPTLQRFHAGCRVRVLPERHPKDLRRDRDRLGWAGQARAREMSGGAFPAAIDVASPSFPWKGRGGGVMGSI